MQKYKTVDEFMNSLDEVKREQVDAIRKLILVSNPTIQEHVKWNAPSYVFDGEDRVTFNLMNKQGLVKLVLHMGATRKENKKGSPVLVDENGIIEWNSDIRGTISFKNMEDVISKKAALSSVLKKWLAIKV
ncbi:DUF1801 domain-containing protein [bacterium]|nr:MAG: DUF1801 domain-containing protein [bacterium]